MSPEIRDVTLDELYAGAANVLDHVASHLEEMRGKPMMAVVFIALDSEGRAVRSYSGPKRQLMRLLEDLEDTITTDKLEQPREGV